MTDSTSTTCSSYRKPGSVTAKNSRTAFAPSTRAASYRLEGIFRDPREERDQQNPNCPHIPNTPTAGGALLKSRAHHRGTSPPSPTA